MLNLRRMVSFRSIRFIVVVALVVGVGLFIRQYFSLQNQLNLIKNDPAKAQEMQLKEAKKLVAEVSKIIELPPDEVPSVATVTDVTKLAKEPFFEHAKNGDRTLIYSKAGKAILYDPKAHKIVAFTSIVINAPQSSPAPTATPAPVRIAIRNGSNTVGLGSKAQTFLTKTIPNLTVSSLKDAASKEHTDSIVSVINQSSAATADQIAELLKTTVTSIPEDEQAPSDIDILIIIGSDFNN